MRASILTILICLGFSIQSASADTWSRSGPRMQVDRSYDGSGSGSVTRELQSGASTSRSTSCDGNPWAASCSSTLNVQSSSGEAYSVERNAAATRYRAGSVTTVTGPEGNTVVSPRRWRRW